jgi:putative DNA primase/helicase
MMGEAATVARFLKARPSGLGWIASCPCPGHGRGRGDKNPSLSIAEGDDGGLLLICRAGCSWGDLKPELERRGALAVGGSKLIHARNALTFAGRTAPDKVEANATALRLWRKDSISLIGTPVSTYLKWRGIMEHPPTLRCCYQHDHDVGMLAAVQRSDGEIIAAQVKMVTRDGRKVPAAHPDTIGALGDGAVRLGAAAEIMGVSEGVETGLSAMALAGLPVWASLGASRLHRIALPDIVREVHIFCDNDQTGQEAARRTVNFHKHAGRRVVVRTPPQGLNDYNDLLLALADGEVSA